MSETKISAQETMDTLRGATKGAHRRRGSRVPSLFMISLVTPVFFFVGSIRLTPFLLLLLGLIVPMTFVWFSGSRTRKILPDYLILFYCIWSAIALFYTSGIELAVQPATIIFLQTFGSYLIGRLFIRNVEQFKYMLTFHMIIVAFLLPFAFYETITTRPILIDILSLAASVYANAQMEPRMGLDRVQGVFEHPILYGVFVGSCFALVLYRQSPRLQTVLFSGIVVLSVFFSLSTGALLCIVVQAVLALWDNAFSTLKNRWTIITIIVLSAYFVVDSISNRSPFDVFVQYLTLNSGTSYNRILIWQFGTAEVWRHPIFGIGLSDWVRPSWMSDSMDNFWLVQAVRYGLPALAAISIAFISVLSRVGRAQGLSQELQSLRIGFVIAMVGVFVAICSVHLWNATFCWLLFMMGGSIWFTEQKADSAVKELSNANTGRGTRDQSELDVLPGKTSSERWPYARQ